MTLSKRQRDFIDAYMETGNGAAAARDAGYSEKAAKEQASRMLTNVNVQAEIEARTKQIMPRHEVIQRLAARARSSIADVLRLPFIGPMPEGQPPQAIDNWAIDLIRAQQTGAIHQIKKIKAGRYGPEIEMYDALPAQELIGKYHGLFVDRHEVTGKDGAPIAVVSAEDLAAARQKALDWEREQDG